MEQQTYPTDEPEDTARQLANLIEASNACEHCGLPVAPIDPRPTRMEADQGWLDTVPDRLGYPRTATGWRWFQYAGYCLDCAERLDRYQIEDGDGFAAALAKMEREDSPDEPQPATANVSALGHCRGCGGLIVDADRRYCPHCLWEAPLDTRPASVILAERDAEQSAELEELAEYEAQRIERGVLDEDEIPEYVAGPRAFAPIEDDDLAHARLYGTHPHEKYVPAWVAREEELS